MNVLLHLFGRGGACTRTLDTSQSRRHHSSFPSQLGQKYLPAPYSHVSYPFLLKRKQNPPMHFFVFNRPNRRGILYSGRRGPLLFAVVLFWSHPPPQLIQRQRLPLSSLLLFLLSRKQVQVRLYSQVVDPNHTTEKSEEFSILSWVKSMDIFDAPPPTNSTTYIHNLLLLFFHNR